MPGHACHSKLLISAISCENLSDAFLDTTGSFAYQGDVVLLQNPAVALRASNGSTTQVTAFEGEFNPTSSCRIAFMVPKPDSPLRGLLTIEFRIVDNSCFTPGKNPWTDCPESNVLSKQVTVQ